MWFYYTGLIPTQIEALILVNILGIGIVDIVISLMEKEDKK